MATFLFNPTNENLTGQYGGRTITVEANGGRIKVDDSCGRHLLNFLGDRGLTFLEIDTDVAKAAKDAVARNRAFKKRMVAEYNQSQEQRKQVGMSFMPATKEIKAYAAELELVLSEPYSIREDAGIVQSLKDQVQTLTTLVHQLVTGKVDPMTMKAKAQVRTAMDGAEESRRREVTLNVDEIAQQNREEIQLDAQGPPDPMDSAILLQAPVRIGAPVKMNKKE